MAGTPSNPDASVGDLPVKPPPDVIIPVETVRQQIHKTADFIFRKGDSFENSIKERSQDNPAFNFLFAGDAGHNYYRWYLQQLKEGNGPGAAGGKAAEAAKPKGPPEPPKFLFSARTPNINAKDLEVIKLTAQYTAKNGESWLKQLRNSEAHNYQFDFLRPNHSYHAYFRNLIDQYKTLLEEDEAAKQARIEQLRRNIEDRFNILDRAKERAEYQKYQSAQKEKEEKKKVDEQKVVASIDWLHFAVIATVEFDEADELAVLPEPPSLNDLQSASLEKKAQTSLGLKRIDEAAPDQQTYYNVSQKPPAMYPVMQPAMPPPVPMPTPPAQPAYVPPPQATGANYASADEERAIRERQAERERAARQQAAAKAPSNVRIVEGYVPKAKKPTGATAICPNCKQSIPANELDEHIRIELLDPNWKEQRAKADARYSSTVATVDVASNLKRFATMRDDTYDSATGTPLSEEEAARRKRAATQYDGQPDSAKGAPRFQEMQRMNVQDQLQHIREKHGGK